jgi:hypothetical protein
MRRDLTIFVAGGMPGYASARQALVIASSIGEVGNMIWRWWALFRACEEQDGEIAW